LPISFENRTILAYRIIQKITKPPFIHQNWLEHTKIINIKDEHLTDRAYEIYVDSCGSRGLDETPKCAAFGGSSAARGKRSIVTKRRFTRLLYLNVRILTD